MDKMKNEMEKINNYSIDIARDPARAIQRISDPILDLLNAKVEDFTDTLKSNMGTKKQAKQELIDLKNFIFEEKVKQINLRREKEEIGIEFGSLREDIEAVQAQAKENVQRKTDLISQIEESTEKFREEAKELREELTAVRERLLDAFKHKEIVED